MKSKIGFWSIGILTVLTSCQNETQLTHEQYVVNGQMIYEEHCANCHGTDGKGLKALYPSLVQNQSLKDVNSVICLILNGRENGGAVMPANTKLYNLDLAQLITYLQFTYLDADTIVNTDEIKSIRASCP